MRAFDEVGDDNEPDALVTVAAQVIVNHHSTSLTNWRPSSSVNVGK
jgi:hypothetical protein